MDQIERTRKSKLLSYILRHHPEKFDLKIDTNGWIDINKLIVAINMQKEEKITHEQILEIVEKCDKQRYKLNDYNTMIKANQGHSVDVELKFIEKIPPKTLYHGTVYHNIDSIKSTGLDKMSRHHVHMTNDMKTAIDVGKRRGRPIICIIDSQKMHKDKIKFYCSENNVWLTENVPPEYITFFEVDNKVGCGGFIILNKEKTKCLLVKANNWGFPKGKKNKAESIYECALRELNEETSLTLDDIDIDYNIPIQYEMSYSGNKAVSLYVAYSRQENVKIKDVDELSEISWLTIDEALNKLDGIKNRRELLIGITN
ncbi:tRNA 2'-phosphotransferase/Ap4A hydrolase [Bodo saltans virus]|uniref:tRNA 2'-phosphotransferase/Ap4A hydrolase n=1 Tax=Bodo saltans virus TaxID=2024608 RepID=A0A2H4UTN1_9VIRU|nr:tRNA 2'-phosphotransferase/Ap4A hydrolase [Bodo saltans virus]ATZ80206.1 tRNA 2'-phosphotransferase/Ap4A hydrolase [Bodo saltans virus]